jgi:hypothetical protein
MSTTGTGLWLGLPTTTAATTGFALEEFDWDDPPPEWRYFSTQLTDEELAEAREQHRKFQKYVGTHTDYDTRGRLDLSGVKPSRGWPKLYDEYKARPKPDYSGRSPSGWFTLKQRLPRVQKSGKTRGYLSTPKRPALAIFWFGT